MDKQYLTIFLAYISLIYIFACIYYIIFTRNLGTPFNEKLKEYPGLMKIKNDSSLKRGSIFYTGFLIGLLLCFIVRPF